MKSYKAEFMNSVDFKLILLITSLWGALSFDSDRPIVNSEMDYLRIQANLLQNLFLSKINIMLNKHEPSFKELDAVNLHGRFSEKLALLRRKE